MDPRQFELHARIEDRHWWFAARRRIVTQLLAQVLPASPDKQVLEIGLGSGGNLLAIKDRYRCIGYDLSEDAVRAARRRLPDVPVHRGDVLADGASCIRESDAVLLLDVLEHIEDDTGFFGRLIELTRPGTWLVMTVPADSSLWGPHDEHHGHHRRYEPDTFAALWRGLPVRRQLLSPMNWRLYPLVRLVRRCSVRTGRTTGPAGTDLTMPPAPLNAMLRSIFEGERHHLIDMLRQRDNAVRAPRRGVSLVAVLQRTGETAS